MAIENRFVALLAAKVAKENRRIPMTEVSKETGIAYKTLYNWAKNEVARFDAPIIELLCEYLDCEPGDLIVRVTNSSKSK